MRPKSSTRWLGLALVTAFAVGFGVLMFQSYRQPASYKRILFVTLDNRAEAIIRGTDLLFKHHPELAKTIDITIRTPDNTAPEDSVPDSDFMLIAPLDGDWFRRHENYLNRTKQSFLAKPGQPTLRLATGVTGLKYTEEQLTGFALKRDAEVEAYLENHGPDDVEQMLVYLLHRYGGYTHLPVQKPVAKPELGMLVHDGNAFRLVKTWAEWEKQTRKTRVGFDPKKPRVGVLITKSYAQEGILTMQRYLIERLERAGMQPVPVYGYPGSKVVKKLLLDTLTNKARIDIAVSELFKFSDKGAEESLAKLGVPVLNAIQIYGPTIGEWRVSKKGLSSQEVAWQLAIPELAGLAPHTVVGGNAGEGQITTRQPIPAMMDKLVGRVRRLVYLQRTAPAQRKVAILYWNYPPGKDNVGASYLNVLRSIPVVLNEFKQRGYNVTNFNPADTRSVEKLIMLRGRNVGKYAPGELKRIVDQGLVETIPVSTYKKWFAELSPTYQREITNHWGPPEKAQIMTVQKAGELHFVIPLIRFGNVCIMPQPDRARSQDIAALYHSQTLPPHHQYLAEYLWLQRNVDALVHTGTHGTQEWLEGKETGLSDTDSPEVMAGDLPIMYIYNMDVVGEGIVSKRRGAATIIDHLTPALGEAGLTPELKKLNGLVSQWEKMKGVNPEGATAMLDDIDRTTSQLGIKKDLSRNGWSEKGQLGKLDEEQQQKLVEALQHYIEDVREHSTPFGLHTFGVSPEKNRLAAFTQLISKSNSGKAEFYQAALVSSGSEERRMLTHGLNGRYVAPASGNDPVRSPGSLPTGRNFYTFDPRTVPVPYADSIGKNLAKNFIQNFRKEHKKFPTKIAFEIWGTETIRHMGMQEAQGLALLGVRLKRDKMGRVEDLELIPRQELGRPRVDVLFSTTGLYRDNFPLLIDLLDKAVQLAASSPEKDNAVRSHADSLYKKLVIKGMDTTQARIRSRVRVFAEPSGTYSSKMSEATYASGTWDKESEVAELYIRRMGNGYGGGIWGESMETEFKAALSGTQAIVHSRTSSLYMTLDNDDFFGFAGAIALGVRHVDKSKSPPVLVADLRQKGGEQHVSLERFMGQELRSRYFNPEYIKGMTAEGYAGAKHVMQGVDYLWGWQVMYPEVVNAEKWQEFYEVWVKDRYDLKTDEFFEEHSPHAKESISARMLEAVRKGYWKPSEAVQQDLAKVYVESVAKHGVSCGHTTCDHPELHTFIKGVALANSNIKASDVTKWVKNVETATGKTIGEALAQRTADKARFHDPKNVKSYDPKNNLNDQQKVQTELAKNGRQKVQGFKMVEEKVIDSKTVAASQPAGSPVSLLYLLVFGTQVLCFAIGGWQRWR